MAKINFKQFKLFTDISQERTNTVDVSRAFADSLYRNGNGIVVHDLAMRIFHSDGEITLPAEDVAIIQGHAKQCCTPLFIDSLAANLEED